MRTLLLALVAAAGAAQTPAFEVASIKVHPGEITFSADPSIRGSRVVSTASTLRDLITYAYGVRYDQLSGGPPWAQTEHYDISAKPPGDAPPTREQAKVMMQALLAERFHLEFHRETKDLPAYALVVAKGGHKLKEAAPDGKGSIVRGSEKGLRMETTKITMEALAAQLSNSAGRRVVDRTGLTGYWAFTFEWMPAGRETDPDRPSMFTAIQEQLGLKLEPTKAPFDMLVIDRAEHPSEN